MGSGKKKPRRSRHRVLSSQALRRRVKRNAEQPRPGSTSAERHSVADRSVVLAVASMVASDPRQKIFYFVPHEPQNLEDASLFGGYTPGLHATAHLLIFASKLPADIREPYTEQMNVLIPRLSRRVWLHSTPIELDSLAQVQPLLPSPFQVFLTNDASVAVAVDATVASARFPCLHLSSIAGLGRVDLRKFTLGHLYDYIGKVLDALDHDDQWHEFSQKVRGDRHGARIRQPIRHELPVGEHNLLTPNESALEAFGWRLHKLDRLFGVNKSIAATAERYVNRICNSADAVYKAREGLLKDTRQDIVDYRYIIAVPSYYWVYQANWRDWINKADRRLRRAVKHVFASVVQADSYMDNIRSTDVELIKDPAFLFLTGQRAADARMFTAGLTRLAALTLAPVLRLEPRINRVRGELKQLGSCVRTFRPPHAQWKASRLTSRLGEELRASVNPKFLSRIDARERDGRIEGLKLVTDLPLELMPSNGVPLSLRYDVSRQPVIPGNLFFANCSLPPVIVPLSAFKEVLVVRSFKSNDPLRDLLERAIAAHPWLEKASFPINVKFVDVDNEGDLIRAVNKFDGACMIFDGHGAYDAESGIGAIVLNSGPVDAWTLRRQCRFPPVVIFSACDTQPLDGSHSSTATAAFTLGARAVLATTLPVQGDLAAGFIARLIYRVSEYVPEALDLKPHLTWREVVAGMLRMTYVTEVQAILAKYGRLKLTRADLEAVQLNANILINQRRADWHEKFIFHLADRLKLQPFQIASEIRRWASMTDSLKYVQLGSPENIVIAKDVDAAALAAYVQSKAQAI